MVSKIICIYHGYCPDGFTAAWIVNRWLTEQQDAGRLPKDQEIEFYGDSYAVPNPPDVTGAHVVMVDFSYKSNLMRTLNNLCRTMLVLDHHKSAGKELEGTISEQTDRSALDIWSEGLFGDQIQVNPIGIFDMDRSGAQIAWDVFYNGQKTPALVSYVQDRDLWKHELFQTKAINQFVMSHEHTFNMWDQIAAALGSYDEIKIAVAEGEAILRQKNLDMDTVLVEAQRRLTLFGYDVPVVNAPHFMASDIARKMFDGSPFVAIYYDLAEGRKFSLRAPDDSDVDVSELARTFDDGGGHAKAAGFTAPAGWEG